MYFAFDISIEKKNSFHLFNTKDCSKHILRYKTTLSVMYICVCLYSCMLQDMLKYMHTCMHACTCLHA